jgi:hypothetical protein
MTMISTLIALPYELARLPLTTLDHGLSRRLPDTSVPRTTLDRAIGSADKLAGTILRNDDILDRGVARVERANALVKAARLEDRAETRRDAAADVAAAGRQEAAAKRQAAAKRASDGLAAAKQAEEQGKQQAARNAEKTAAAKKAAADKTAAKRTETVEQRKKRVAAAAEAKKKAARQEAKAELDDARQSTEAAAEARADAEVLSDLTEAKKQERKQD